VRRVIHCRLVIVLVVVLVVTAAGCSHDPDASSSSKRTASTTATTTAVSVTNRWEASGSVVPTAIPLGDGKASTTAATVGSVHACQAGNPNAGGATANVPWIHGTTWDSTAKVTVQGSVSWPTADFSVAVEDDRRVIVTNGLPTEHVTGAFPIAAGDPAYQYDRNPNSIAARAISVSLPVTPAPAASPGCLPFGAVGILLNGVVLFHALDARGLDAVAHETQDVCDGHPAPGNQYHYHEVPSCLRDAATGSSTLIGWAYDGYPIYVERDAAGSLPTNADLDECHGRTSPVLLDGKVVTTYHYSATLEYPYTIGCFRAANAVTTGR
jgi:hypothetical protein